MAQGYPVIAVKEMLIDAMAMRLVRDPENFDVLVTTNLFGDILSDEGSALIGGLGVAPSANVGEGSPSSSQCTALRRISRGRAR